MDTVVKAVIADTLHPLIVVQACVVTLCTVELPVGPERKEVVKSTVCVQWVAAELAVHGDKAELLPFVEL